MEKVRRIDALAERICEYWGITTETGIADMVTTLWNEKRRKAIAADLMGEAEYTESDAKAYEASMLWREVIAL